MHIRTQFLGALVSVCFIACEGAQDEVKMAEAEMQAEMQAEMSTRALEA